MVSEEGWPGVMMLRGPVIWTHVQIMVPRTRTLVLQQGKGGGEECSGSCYIIKYRHGVDDDDDDDDGMMRTRLWGKMARSNGVD